jgi:DNA-binding XRE family transcriptional regulator
VAHAKEHLGKYSGDDVLGSQNPNSKLNEKQVKNIRLEYNRGKITQKILAKKYGVSTATINLIVRNKCWKHI